MPHAPAESDSVAVLVLKKLLRRALAGAILAILALAAYVVVRLGPHAWSRPVVSKDLVGSINELRVRPGVPTAWPLYRSAFAKLPSIRDAAIGPLPEDPEWPAFTAWLVEHHEGVEALRRAAMVPELGVALGDPESAVPELGRGIPPSAEDAVRDQKLPWLVALRASARALAGEALRRAQAGDVDGAIPFIEGTLGIAFQLREGLEIEQLVGCSVFTLAAGVVGKIAAIETLAMTPNQRSRINKLFAEFDGGAPWRPDFRQEALSFEDVLQRAYSDSGDAGIMTVEGSRLVDRWVPGKPEEGPDVGFVKRLLRSARMPRRGVERAEYERRRELLDRLFDGTPRPSNWRAEFDQHVEGGRYCIAPFLGPAENIVDVADKLLAVRTSVPVVLALQAHRQRTGAWPASLDELVPSEIVAVQREPVPENTLDYSLEDGKPFLTVTNRHGAQALLGKAPSEHP